LHSCVYLRHSVCVLRGSFERVQPFASMFALPKRNDAEI
jgi:hypothetical protein